MTHHIQGRWEQPIPMLMAWIMDHNPHANLTCMSQPPENLREHLPLLVISAAPGGAYDDYTRTQALDLDVYAPTPAAAAETIQTIEPSLAALQGDGNELGYVDTSTMTTFTQINSSMTGVTRMTATITLSMRPQPRR